MPIQHTSLSAALEGLRVCALIDPALCPDALSHRTTRDARALEVQGVGATDEAAKTVLPFLVALSDDAKDRQRQLSAFETWALESHSVSWLVASAPADALASLLGQRLDVMLSDEQPALLRISDTRILPAVHSVLTDVERAQFLAPVHQWWYFDRQEKLQRITCEPESDAGVWKTPWRLAPAQESALLLAAEPDTVLALLREQAAQKLQEVPRAQRHSFVSEQMHNAREWGLESAEQHALYCMIALSLGAGFSEQPAWRLELAKVRDKTITLTQAIETIEQGMT